MVANKVYGRIEWLEPVFGLSRGVLSLMWDNGDCENLRYDGKPIDASTISDDIAVLFGVEVECHDRETIFISRKVRQLRLADLDAHKYHS